MTDEAGNTEPEEFESDLVVSAWEDQEPLFSGVMREGSCTFFFFFALKSTLNHLGVLRGLNFKKYLLLLF